MFRASAGNVGASDAFAALVSEGDRKEKLHSPAVQKTSFSFLFVFGGFSNSVPATIKAKGWLGGKMGGCRIASAGM